MFSFVHQVKQYKACYTNMKPTPRINEADILRYIQNKLQYDTDHSLSIEIDQLIKEIEKYDQLHHPTPCCEKSNLKLFPNDTVDSRQTYRKRIATIINTSLGINKTIFGPSQYCDIVKNVPPAPRPVYPRPIHPCVHMKNKNKY